MASKAAAGLEDHHREVIVAKGMENTPTLRTIASETKKSLLNRVDVSDAFFSFFFGSLFRLHTTREHRTTRPLDVGGPPSAQGARVGMSNYAAGSEYVQTQTTRVCVYICSHGNRMLAF